MLDFTVTAAELGKPAGADLKLGLATAPVLFAWEEYPELEALIKRKFSKKGDEEQVSTLILYFRRKKKFNFFFFNFQARDLVYQSDGLKKTLDLAEVHCKLATDALYRLPPSDARSALIQITEKLLTRRS
jgi:hexaprenyl-diphosphate synthase